jgi:hypothetical protein
MALFYNKQVKRRWTCLFGTVVFGFVFYVEIKFLNCIELVAHWVLGLG